MAGIGRHLADVCSTDASASAVRPPAYVTQFRAAQGDRRCLPTSLCVFLAHCVARRHPADAAIALCSPAAQSINKQLFIAIASSFGFFCYSFPARISVSYILVYTCSAVWSSSPY